MEMPESPVVGVKKNSGWHLLVFELLELCHFFVLDFDPLKFLNQPTISVVECDVYAQFTE